ncbi:tail fiber assembly protein [Enterobacter cloacae]|uniref:Tail fiber assembly protein n=1 Tax=Enterobacter cloacae TaxID=550 RepID=A0AAW6S729_ENTCL|nr:tail fiber assembly protein [Enterobacter cloacae]MDH0197548.1 tail fiber assembly protein [Enterobacter cloacae]
MTIYNKEAKLYSISGYNNYAWSASKNVFYLIADLLAYIRAGNWPDDAVEVSDDVFNEFASFQNGNGMIRGVSSDGLPAWVAPPEPSKEMLIRNAEVNRDALTARASREIDILTDAESDGSITDEEKELLAKWKAYRLALRRLDLTSAPDIDWPEQP